MSRENFFLLLGLSLEPPESDPAVIEQTIRKKQALWSRLRNHPTKGIQAQKYIGLIPEIRKVMADPDRRQKEAEAAQKMLAQRETDRFQKLDRHIALLAFKGEITAKELERLAKGHGVSPDLVRSRIPAAPTVRGKGLAGDIAVHARKGFVSEAEIKHLARRHRLTEAKVRAAVTCPVRQEENGLLSARPLDKSIETTIQSNLKVVGKATLYDFLDLDDTTPLDLLQDRASRKEAQSLKSARKDGITTASAVLAGQCKTVFRDEESRRAYDASLVHARLPELHEDIEMAAADGRIRADCFAVLVQTAMTFGMDYQEARDYVGDYCRRKNWAVQKAKRPLNKRWLAAAIALLVLAGLAGGWGLIQYRAGQRLERDYQAMLAKAQHHTDPARTIEIWNAFLEAHPASKYSAQVEDRIQQAREAHAGSVFAATDQAARDLQAAGDLEKARAEYAAFLQDHPESGFSAKARQQMERIDQARDDRAFEALSQPAPADVFQRVTAGTDYLARFPGGRHREAVMEMLARERPRLEQEIQQRLVRHEAEAAWDECLELMAFYRQHYPDGDEAQTFAMLAEVYRGWAEEMRIFQELQKTAALDGGDYEAAKAVFQDYLAAHPAMSDMLRHKIETVLADLNRQQAEARIQAARAAVTARLAAAPERFEAVRQGVVLDKETGLMWSMTDSQDELGKRLDYEAAQRYVSGMDTGGFTDWRMPTLAELEEVCRADTPFPAAGGKWYWSADRFKKFEQRWIFMVDTLDLAEDGARNPKKRYEWDEGVVRGVRRP